MPIWVTDPAFGAKGDGATDNAAAIQAALDAADADGGDEVRFPRGRYLTSETILGRSGVHLRGEDATIVRASHSGGTLLSFANVSDFSVVGLTLNGNMANQTTSGHGLRCANVSDFYLGNIRIYDAFSYGIGLQGDSHKRGVIENIWITRTGADGIDIKNKGNDSEALILNNITVTDPGMRPGITNQAGIDIRSPVHMSNINVLLKTTVSNVDGVRFRFGDTTLNGIGGRNSHLTNVYVEAAPGLSPGYGVAITHENVKVSQGYVKGMSRGVLITHGDARRVTVEGVTAESCRHGFEDKCDDNHFVSCRAIGCLIDGFRLNGAQRTTLTSCDAVGNDNGFRRINGTADTIFIGCRAHGNLSHDWA